MPKYPFHITKFGKNNLIIIFRLILQYEFNWIILGAHRSSALIDEWDRRKFMHLVFDELFVTWQWYWYCGDLTQKYSMREKLSEIKRWWKRYVMLLYISHSLISIQTWFSLSLTCHLSHKKYYELIQIIYITHMPTTRSLKQTTQTKISTRTVRKCNKIWPKRISRARQKKNNNTRQPCKKVEEKKKKKEREK